MRVLLLLTTAFLAAAPAAMAQGIHADGLRPKPSVDGVETSPIQRLPVEARAWIAGERARQKAQPGALETLALDIDRAMGEAVTKVAKRERMGTGDLLLLIMRDVVLGAREDMEADLRRGEGAPAEEVRAAAERKSVLDALASEVIEQQTMHNRALLASLGGQ